MPRQSAINQQVYMSEDIVLSAATKNAYSSVVPAGTGVKPHDHDWATIVSQIQARDETGVVSLYKIVKSRYSLQLARQLERQDVEDKLHETFLIVVAAIQEGRLQHPERIMGFVRTVAQRQVAAYIKQAVRFRQREHDFAPTVHIRCQKAGPEEFVMLQERTSFMRAILAEMPDRTREILKRFYLLEQRPEQICLELGLTETQFRLMKSRAKAVFAAAGRKKLRLGVARSAQSAEVDRCA
jgi:RNA polymerase sigma-70 factor (ECF subfamily)